MYANLSQENAALKDVIAKKLSDLLNDVRSPPIWSYRMAFRFSGPVPWWGWAEPPTTAPS